MTLEKPSANDFFVAGYWLRDALSIIDRWDSLSDAERAATWQALRPSDPRDRRGFSGVA
jgi:hypothetical protein